TAPCNHRLFQHPRDFTPTDYFIGVVESTDVAATHYMTTHEEIERRGFSILSAAFLRDEMKKCIHDLEHSELRRSEAGIRHALRHEGIRDLSADPRLLNLAREILGHEAIPFRATLFDKSPQANWLVVWHQDTALPIRERHEVVGWRPWSVKDSITYA